MAKYKLWIKSRGRGQRETTVTASGFEDLRKKANSWLEYGTEVTVKYPGGKVRNFTTR